jgi:hypothetical protein
MRPFGQYVKNVQTPGSPARFQNADVAILHATPYFDKTEKNPNGGRCAAQAYRPVAGALDIP